MTDTNRDDEISLIDIAVFVAENWVWIVLVPIIIGVAAFFIASTMPQNYRAEASMTPPPQAPTLFLPTYQVASGMDGVVVNDRRITISAIGSDQGAARGLVQNAYDSIIDAARASIEREREAVIERQEAVDRYWDDAGLSPELILSLSSISGQLTERTDRLAIAEQWLLQARPSTIVRPTALQPQYVAILALIISSALAALIVFGASKLRGRDAT